VKEQYYFAHREEGQLKKRRDLRREEFVQVHVAPYHLYGGKGDTGHS